MISKKTWPTEHVTALGDASDHRRLETDRAIAVAMKGREVQHFDIVPIRTQIGIEEYFMGSGASLSQNKSKTERGKKKGTEKMNEKEDTTTLTQSTQS